MKGFWLGLLMCINYMVQALNIRAIAHVHYPSIVVTETAIGIITFMVIKWVAEAKTIGERIWYTVGGTIGALLGVWLSRGWSA